MVRIIVTRAAVALLLVMALAVSQAQAEVYIFSGVLPGDPSDPDSSQALYEAYDVVGTDLDGYNWFGESWTVTLEVNTPGLDEFDMFSDWGYYTSAVVSATLKVSNGYELTMGSDVAQAHQQFFSTIQVYDDFGGADGISADVGYYDSILDDNLPALTVSVFNEDDPSPLSSDALPLAGTSFAHSSSFNQNGTNPGDTVFDFATAGGGWLAYNSQSGEFFQAVPEPSALALWCLGALGLGAVWWRRRRGS